MTHQKWKQLPTPPTKTEVQNAQIEAKKLLEQAKPLLEQATALADKFGFNLDFDLMGTAYSRFEYIPEYTEESMWMPSDEDIEGSGYLNFSWTSSTEGTWVSEADLG